MRLQTPYSATFARRNTALPALPLLALTREFGVDEAKQRQWQAFLRKGRIDAGTLAETIELLYTLLWPASQVAANASDANATWQARLLRWA